MPDPIVFAPLSVLLDRSEPCDSCHDTPHEARVPELRVRGMACHKRNSPSVHGACREKVDMVQEALSHAPSTVHRQGDLGDEVDGTKRDTIRVLSDDDGALWSPRKAV